MKRSFIVSLSFLLIGTSAAAVYYYQETVSLRRQLAAVASTSEPEVEHAGEAEIESHPSDSPDALVVVEAPAPISPPPPENRREDRRAQRNERFSRMMSDPAMREATLSRIKSRVDEEYSGLFVRLGLDEDQTEALRTLIGQRRMAYMQAGFLERNADGNEQEIAEIKAWRESELATTAAGIESVLGADGLDVLTDYREGRGEREFVESISRQASYSGEAIDPQTSEQLVDVVRDVKRSIPLSTNPYERTDDGPPPPLTRQGVAQYLEERKAQDQAILAEAQGMLSQSQMEALADRQIEQFQREQSQLDFQLRNPDMNEGRRWFGGRGP